MEDKAWALINAKNHIAAAELLETAVGELDHPVLQHLRVMVHQKLGNQSQVTKWLGALRESYKNDPTEDVAAPLLGAMWVAGKLDEAFYLGKEIVQRFPEIPDVWRAFSDTALRYDKELAIHCYRRFLETSGTPTQWSAMYVSGMGREIAERDPEKGALLLQAGLLLKGRLEGDPLIHYLLAGQNNIASQTMKEQMDSFSLDDRGSKLLRMAYEQTYVSGAKQWRQVLNKHLISTAGMVREHGARTVFVSYPFYGESEDVLHATALETNEGFVNIRKRFDRELKTKSREELFALDGHCNDAGYAIVAEEVSNAILALLGR